MTTYNTYQEAKIANPERIIHKYDSGFTAESISEHGHSLQPCNPADYCMTVERFLADGYKFAEGDVALIHNGDVKVVENPNLDWNILDSRDNERYILRAAALEEKSKRTRVEYVKVEFSSNYEHLKLMIDGDKFYTWDGEIEYSFNGARFIGKEKPNHNLHAEWSSPKRTELYRRIETEIDERQEFIEASMQIAKEQGTDDDRKWLGMIFDKLVN